MDMMEYGLLTEEEMNAIDQGSELTETGNEEVKSAAAGAAGAGAGVGAGAAGAASPFALAARRASSSALRTFSSLSISAFTCSGLSQFDKCFAFFI